MCNICLKKSKQLSCTRSDNLVINNENKSKIRQILAFSHQNRRNTELD